MKKILKLIVVTLHFPLYFLSRFVKKREDLWLFGAWYGLKFSDNSRALFEYIANYTDINPIWMTKDKILLKEIRKKGYRAYAAFSIKGYFYSLKAGKVIISQSILTDANPYLISNKTIKVQLWHGVPIKKIGKDVEKRLVKCKWIHNYFYFFNNLKYDMVLATSVEVAKNMKSAFDVPSSNIKILGYPRNDILFKGLEKVKKKKILYAPTLRGNKGDRIDIFEKYHFPIAKLESLLTKYNAAFDFKTHPVNMPPMNFINKIENIENINFIGDVEINEILAQYDILITDYSSIFIDYLLLNRPIIFAAFDLEEYKKDRGLYYKYETITPGVIAENWNFVFIELQNLLENRDNYKEKRNNLKDFFHLYKDSKSCERVFNELLRLKS